MTLKLNFDGTDKSSLKPIETHYNGYRFRSRLEARWAVFFDTLGVKYEYEKEGYDLGEAGYYLPDFWLPDFETFVEIKGAEPTEAELERCWALLRDSGKNVFMLIGTIGEHAVGPFFPVYQTCEDFFRTLELIYWLSPDRDLFYDVGKKDVAELLATDEMYKGALATLMVSMTPGYHIHQAKAIQAARAARFEHGETPQGSRV